MSCSCTVIWFPLPPHSGCKTTIIYAAFSSLPTTKIDRTTQQEWGRGKKSSPPVLYLHTSWQMCTDYSVISFCNYNTQIFNSCKDILHLACLQQPHMTRDTFFHYNTVHTIWFQRKNNRHSLHLAADVNGEAVGGGCINSGWKIQIVITRLHNFKLKSGWGK